MALPQSDVIVIGGGVIGCMTAWKLARAGLQVTLLERGACGKEASWAGAGLLDPGNTANHQPLSQLRADSLCMYPSLAAELKHLTGIDIEFARRGSLYLITNNAQQQAALQKVQASAGCQSASGLPRIELLTQQAVGGLEPEITSDHNGAVLNRDVAQVRSPRLLAAVLRACQVAGVDIREQTEVLELLADSSTAAGDIRINGVRTNLGDVSAPHVVLAAGAWSAGLGAAQAAPARATLALQVGGRRGTPPAVKIRENNPIANRLAALMPVHPVRGQIVLYQTGAPPIRHVVEVGSRYLIARDDGHLLAGSTREHDSGFDKSTTATGIAGLRAFAEYTLPCLTRAVVARTWAGLRPGTPDGRPYIGPVPGLLGLLAATGHHMSGIILAPATADIIVQYVTTGGCDRDCSPFAPGRGIKYAAQDD